MNNADVTCSSSDPVAFGASCSYECTSGFTGTGSVICGDDDNDGTGQLSTPSCTGSLLHCKWRR